MFFLQFTLFCHKSVLSRVCFVAMYAFLCGENCIFGEGWQIWGMVQSKIEFYLVEAAKCDWHPVWCWVHIDQCKSHVVKVLPEQTDQTSKTTNHISNCTERTLNRQWHFKAFDHKCSSKLARLKTWHMQWIWWNLYMCQKIESIEMPAHQIQMPAHQRAARHQKWCQRTQVALINDRELDRKCKPNLTDDPSIWLIQCQFGWGFANVVNTVSIWLIQC